MCFNKKLSHIWITVENGSRLSNFTSLLSKTQRHWWTMTVIGVGALSSVVRSKDVIMSYYFYFRCCNRLYKKSMRIGSNLSIELLKSGNYKPLSILDRATRRLIWFLWCKSWGKKNRVCFDSLFRSNPPRYPLDFLLFEAWSYGIVFPLQELVE